MQQVMSTLLEGLPGYARQQEVARRLASLPMRMGGFGLRSEGASGVLGFMG